MIYRFPKAQAALVSSGEKRQTLRRSSHRNAKVGERLALMCGRSKLIDPMPECTAAIPVSFVIGAGGALADVEIGGARARGQDVEELARSGGFGTGLEGVETMGLFYLGLHGEGAFSGVLIRW